MYPFINFAATYVISPLQPQEFPLKQRSANYKLTTTT